MHRLPRLPRAALLADEPSEFAAAALRLAASDDAAWRAASAAATATFERMERADPATSDMAALLTSVCDAARAAKKYKVDLRSLERGAHAGQAALDDDAAALRRAELEQQQQCAAVIDEAAACQVTGTA